MSLKHFFQAPQLPRRARQLGAFAVLAFAACTLAHAYSMRCVTNVDQLKSAVHDAEIAPEYDVRVINVHTGIYVLDGDLQFQPDGSHDAKDFVMMGGWTDPDCTDENSRIVDPNMTIIGGIPSTPQTFGSTFSFLGDNKSYRFESVRFTNFGNFILDDGYCYPTHICPDTYSIRLEHVQFDHGESIFIDVNDAETFVFRNNLVHHMKPIFDNGTGIYSAPVGILIQNNEDPPQISYNTFADIGCFNSYGGVMIQSRNPAVALHHNIFQTTDCAYDLYIDGSESGQPQTAFYNLLLSANNLANLAGNGNVMNYPQFADAFHDNYHLADTSPAVNAGATLTQSLLHGFSLSTVDLEGNFRPVGTRWDIGAFESAVNDGIPAVITVNSNDDVDDGTCNAAHCSLREAINKANAQDNTAQSIVFNIPGSCPQIILLKSALPDITDTVTVDGYSQPGSAENDLDYGSDATICVLIGPAANFSHVFSVPAGQPDTTSLTVRGIGFGNSFFSITTVAIDLRAGSGHNIGGNVFGGYLPTSGDFVGSLTRGVFLGGASKYATVGGATKADRNYFGSLSENGIVINLTYNNTGSEHIIRNNYIGVRPDGLTAQANSADGISSSNGAGVLIDKNTIAASDYGISLLSGTKNYTVTRNNIGVNALGILNASLPNNVGIAIGLGSGGHTIGAAPLENVQAGTFSNLISNNNGDGILLASDAGGSNSIRGNAVFSNGKGGSGIGIDLGGSLAQLANDVGDGDSGPNTKQNYPVITGSSPIDSSTRKINAILGTSANQTLRVDFYQSPTCGGVKGANATNLVGSYDVNSGASGIVNVSTTIAEAGKSGYLTATATTSTGQTSELAPCVLEDVIFADNAEKPGL